MTRLFAISILLWTSLCPVLAQVKTPLYGLVTLQNSGNQPIHGAMVKALWANPTTTRSDGNFELEFINKKPGYEVVLEVQYKGFEVVNKKDLLTTLKADPNRKFKIYMCREGEWTHKALQYYQINEAQITLQYRTAVTRAQQALVNNQALMADSLAKLLQMYENAVAHAQELAEKFAIINLDDVSDLYKKAFEQFQQGNIEAALAILDDEKLDGDLQKAKQEQQQAAGLIALAQEKQTNAEEAIRQVVESYRLKAQLCIANFQFEEARSNYRKMVSADSTDMANQLEYGAFLYNQNQLGEARLLFELMLQQVERAYQKADILNNLSLIYGDLGEPEREHKTLKESLKIRIQIQKEFPGQMDFRVAESYNNLGNFLKSQGQIDSALLAFNKALEIYNGIRGENPGFWRKDIAGLYNNIGTSLNRQNRFEEANLAFDSALVLYQRLLQNEPEHNEYYGNLALVQHNWGVMLEKWKNYPAAGEKLKQALVIRKKLARENPERYLPDLAQSLIATGLVADRLDQPDSAITAYNKAIAIYRDLVKSNPVRYGAALARALGNQGKVQQANLQSDAAHASLLESWQILDSLMQYNPARYEIRLAESQYNLGLFFWHQNQNQIALSWLRKAISVYRRYSGSDPAAHQPGMASAREAMGVVYMDLGYRDSARMAHEEALEIRRSLVASGAESMLFEVSNSLNNLGIVHKESGQYVAALASYEEARAILEALVGREPVVYLPQLASVFHNLGLLGMEMTYDSLVQASLEQAITIRRQLVEQIPKKYRPGLASSLNSLGNYYRSQQHWAKSQEAYREALTIRKSLAQEQHDPYLGELAQTYNNLGLLYRKQKQFDKAKTQILHAFKIRSALAGQRTDPVRSQVATSLHDLGNVYRDLKQFDSAIVAYTEAIEIRKQITGTKAKSVAPGLATAWNQLGRSYNDLKKYEEAGKAYQEAISIRRELAGRQPDQYLDDLATVLDNFGLNQYESGDYSGGKAAHEEAIEIYSELTRKNPDEYDLDLCRVLTNLYNYQFQFLEKEGLAKLKTEGLENLLKAEKLIQKHPDDAKMQDLQRYVDFYKPRFESANPKALQSRKEAREYAREGRKAREAGDPEAAQRAYERSIAASRKSWKHQEHPNTAVEYARTLSAYAALEKEVKDQVVQEEKAVALWEYVVDEVPENKAVRSEFATTCGNLAYNCLLISSFRKAEQYALRGLELDSEQEWIISNLAPAFLLQGKFAEAEQLYRKWKDKPFDANRSFREAFVEDLDVLQAAGVEHPDMRKIRTLLKK